MSILVTRSSMPDFEEYCAEIRDLWDSHWLTNMGDKHRQLQRELEEQLRVEHVTLYTNGHLALENILAAFELPQGGEVITTPFTFASTTHAIVRCGLTPVFCDVNEEDYTLDVSKVESLITEKTVAILPVHVYGGLCDVSALERIAKEHGLKLIYDAAHAFGVEKDGISAACFGDASMFSFHATKVFNTIEGGAVCYHDDGLVQRLDDLKNFGIRGPEDCAYVGGNAKMNEFQAAMGLCNLRHLDREIEKRRAVDARYRQRLEGAPSLKLRAEQPGVKANYAYFPVLFQGKLSRDRAYELLAEQDIFARKYFYPLTNAFDCYRDLPGGPEKTPVALRLSQQVLTLPIYADLDLQDVDRICDILLSNL